MMSAGWRGGSREDVPWIWSREAGAARLLDEARRSLSVGQVLEARRRLEMLVGRYPDSTSAEEARIELAQIYAQPVGDRGPPPAGPNSSGRSPDTRSVSESRVPAPAGGAGRVVAVAVATRNEPSPGVDPTRDGSAATTMAARLRESVGDRVFFGEGSAELGGRARALIAAQAQWLRSQPVGGSITVEAFADDRGGGEKYNLEMAAQRAEAVRVRLVAEGIDANRIVTRVFGRQRPVAACPDPECAAQNRRVVVVPGVATNQAMLEPDLSSAYMVPRSGPLSARRTGN
jgi:peptidoglycan-associated lipoprotein